MKTNTTSIGGVVIIPFLEGKKDEVVCVMEQNFVRGVEMVSRWKFPGGKVRTGETFKEAALRKLKEEAGKPTQLENPLWLHVAFQDIPHLELYLRNPLQRGKEIFVTTEIPKKLLAANSQFTSAGGLTVRTFSYDSVFNEKTNFLNLHRTYLRAALDHLASVKKS
jgi:8-oxo-dGTP pyrophosphatase MutT (NUDIX family)